MADELLSAREAARRLGISVPTLYDWLGQSDRGRLLIRGQSVSIRYLQGGPRGQGRIKLEAAEVDRLKELLVVQPQHDVPRRPPVRYPTYPGITVKLGAPPP